jgi:hypothetical protein
MKLPLFFSGLLFAASFASAQTTGVVSPAPSKPLTIYAHLVGVAQGVTLGNLDKTGKARVDLEMDFSKIPVTAKKDYWITIAELFGFCDDSQEFFSNEKELVALELDPLFLYDDEKFAGAIILVSNPATFKWQIGGEDEDAVLGSYFGLVYLRRDFAFKGSCLETYSLEDGNLETSHEIDVDLREGFNCIEYKVESVHAASEEMAASPNKVVITSHAEIPGHAAWMAFYY